MTDKILENAFCFILEAIEKLDQFEEDASDRDLKYAICHLFSGITLLLKAKLSEEHWSLILQDPNKSTKKDFESGDFRSISFDVCQKRLENICSIKLSKDDQELLNDLRKKRNQAEHFFVTEDNLAAFKTNLDKALQLALKLRREWFRESNKKDQ